MAGRITLSRDLVDRLKALYNESKDAFRRIMREVAKLYAKAGYSAEAWVQEMRRLGLGYRYQEMREDFRWAKGVLEVRERLKYVPKNKRPDPSKLPVVKRAKYGRYVWRFRAVFRCITSYGVFTHEDYITLETNEVYTRATLEEMACRYAEQRRVEICMEEASESCECFCEQATLVDGARVAE